MAGDWYVPVRVNLPRDRKVLAISAMTGRSRHEVTGLLIDFWGWVSIESRDGHVPSVTKKVLCDAIGGCDEAFWSAVEDVGWAVFTDGGVTVPDFDDWLGKIARVRIQANLRQQERRAKQKEGGKCHSVVTPPSRSERDKKASCHAPKLEMEMDTSPPPPPKNGGAVEGGEGREIEEAWAIYRELLAERRTGRLKIQDLDAYVAKIRREHRHPCEVMPEIVGEFARRKAARAGKDRKALVARVLAGGEGRRWTTAEGKEYTIDPGGLRGAKATIPWGEVPPDLIEQIADELTMASVVEKARNGA